MAGLALGFTFLVDICLHHNISLCGSGVHCEKWSATVHFNGLTGCAGKVGVVMAICHTKNIQAWSRHSNHSTGNIEEAALYKSGR